MNKTDKIRIVIIDDHMLFREGLKSILANESGMNVIGEAEDGESGLEYIQTAQPDVILLDISIPGISGIEVCRQITNRFPEIKTIILTMHKSGEYLAAALGVGAKGFILKHSAVTELTTAIRTVYSGKKYISSDLTEEVLDKYMIRVEEEQDPDIELTSKEKEIVLLIAQGWETQQIGKALHISPATVKTHRANLMKKLNVHKNIELVKYALKMGLIELD